MFHFIVHCNFFYIPFVREFECRDLYHWLVKAIKNEWWDLESASAAESSVMFCLSVTTHSHTVQLWMLTWPAVNKSQSHSFTVFSLELFPGVWLTLNVSFEIKEQRRTTHSPVTAFWCSPFSTSFNPTFVCSSSLCILTDKWTGFSTLQYLVPEWPSEV